MKIPASVDNDTRIPLAGEGEVGPGGGPAGDLYVEIHELPHETTLVPSAAAVIGIVTVQCRSSPRR